MAETGGAITGNSDPVAGSDGLLSAEDMIIRQLAHQDENLHALMRQADRIEAHLTAMQADLDAARPLLEKWQKSGLAKLAQGRMPWAQ